MSHGYHGCYLRIDVTTGFATRVPLADATLRQFLGGSGLGVRLLLDEGAADVDPLAPEAPGVRVQPAGGQPADDLRKFAVVSKSPLTDRINDSLASSGFAVAGKRCGCDALMIVGRAAELSVLIVEQDGNEERRRGSVSHRQPRIAGRPARRPSPGCAPSSARNIASPRSVPPASSSFATPRSRTMAGMPDGAAGAALEQKTSRRLPSAAAAVSNGPVRRS